MGGVVFILIGNKYYSCYYIYNKMNEKLKELYYQDDVIIGSKQNFINIAKKSLNASTKEINEFLKNQEINQVNKKQNKHTNLKITAPPRTYQIDIMYYPIGEILKMFC